MDKRHFKLIYEYCEVLAEVDNGIWYIDGNFKYADVYNECEGWLSYSCDSLESFYELCELGV